MTTVAAIFGMLPIVLASGDGEAEVKNGMAWAIIGGLTSSSILLTLVLVPTMYYIVTRLMEMASGMRVDGSGRRWRSAWWRRDRPYIMLIPGSGGNTMRGASALVQHRVPPRSRGTSGRRDTTPRSRSSRIVRAG